MLQRKKGLSRLIKLPWRYWGRWLTEWSRRLPVKFDLRAVSIAEGLRAALATATLIALSEFLNYPDLSWSAVAAFWICLADPGGRVELRLATMGLLTVAGAVIAAFGSWIGLSGPWVVVPATFLIAFGGSYIRVFTPRLVLLGQLLTVNFLVSLDRPQPTLAASLVFAGLFLLGGGWAIIVTLGLWRVRPEQPARDAVSRCYRALADYVEDLRKLVLARTHDPDTWGNSARRHRTQIREAIEIARDIMRETRLLRLGASRRGEQRAILLETCDKAFADLIALNDLLERYTIEGGAAMSRTVVGLTLRRLHHTLHDLAVLMVDDRVPPDHALQASVRALADQVEHSRETPMMTRGGHLFADLVRCMTVAVGILEGRRQIIEIADPSEAATNPIFRRSVIRPLTDNFRPSSLNFQHSLRVAVTVAIGALITHLFHLERGYWLTMTTCLIMQPSFGTTWLRAVERVVGSVLGSAFSAALGLVFQSPLAIAIALFPLSALTMALRPVSYTVFMLFVTPQFVLVAGLGEPGSSELMLTGYRVANTVIGGVLALIGSIAFWPSWEPTQLPRLLSAAIAANAKLLTTILKTDKPEEGLRREAGIASNNAEASLQRVAFEPARDLVSLDAANILVTSVRRMTASTMALALLPHDRRDKQRQLEFAAWADQVLAHVEGAIEQKEQPMAAPARPGARPGAAKDELEEQLDTIELQIRVIVQAARRLAGGEGAIAASA
jgi:uncharacterized membrane protein YccC